MPGNKLDATDLRILNTFIEHGAMSNVQLSAKVHLSESACHQRVSALKSAGILRGFVADIDFEAIVKPISVLTLIELESQNDAQFEKLSEAIHREPYIMRAYRIAGAYDYALMSIAPSFDAYMETIQGVSKRAGGVKKYNSYVMHQMVKDQSPTLDELTQLAHKKL
ncbi:MAG: Lrp/AsnC family transcriptional regulator [Pseudomonadota bacterium]